MRAAEFIRENVEHFNGLDFSIEIEKDDEYVDNDDTDNQTIYVKAFANGRELGHVLFTIDYDGQGMILKPQDLEVEERYQGQGIAATMYDYVKSKGYRIRRSGQQTDAGAGFWNKHRPEQNVWEAFDKPYPHEIQQKSEFGDYDTLVRLPDGNYLSIMFTHEGNDEWQVEFYRNNSQEVTGEGDAQRIFATVLNAMQKFIKEHKPWRLIFSAKKDVDPGQNSESRAKLYSRLVQRYAAAWGYDDYSEDHGDQVVYELTQLKRSIAEGKKRRRRNKYFGGYWYPGYGYYGSGAYGGESGDSGGGDGGGGESVTEAKSNKVLFIGNDTAIVGQEHGKRLQLSDQEAKRVRAIAQRHGAWYEGNGMDRKLTAGIIDRYRGSWDDDLLSPAIKGYPAPFLYVLFSNIEENDTVEGKIGSDPDSTIFDRILDTQPSTNYFPDRRFDAETLEKFLRSASEGEYDFVRMSQAPATERNVRRFFTMGERLMFPDNWEEYPYRAGRVAKRVNDLRDRFLASRKRGVYVAGSDHLRAVQQFLDQNKQGVAEVKQPGKTVVDAIQQVLPVAQEIWFHGSRATGKHRKNSDTDILVVVPDDLVGDQYLGVVRILQKLSTQFDNHDIQPTKAGTNMHRIAQEEGQLLWSITNENFADGRVKGKSRPGRVKRAGASCDGSVSSLRQKAKNSGGERGRMYHWCANMKSGRQK